MQTVLSPLDELIATEATLIDGENAFEHLEALIVPSVALGCWPVPQHVCCACSPLADPVRGGLLFDRETADRINGLPRCSNDQMSSLAP